MNGVFGRDTSKKTTEEELCEARNQLELRVADRTAELEKANADLDASTDRLFGRDTSISKEVSVEAVFANGND